MSARSGTVASVMRRAAQLDRDWQRKGPVTDPRFTPWMPFNLGEFTGLLAEAVAGYEPGDDEDISFLDVGCGPGSKMLVARDIFGLDALGFDIQREYVAAACSLGLNAHQGDARIWPGYGRAQITWFNRVARDPGIQARIESKVWEDTAPGAVVMCANLENRPPQAWFPVVDDWEARRGAWMKPGGTPSGW